MPSTGVEEALYELTYYHQWHYFSIALDINRIGYRIDDNRETTLVPHLVLNRELAEILGLTQIAFNVDTTYIANKPHRLTVHQEFCVHLAQSP